MKTVYTFFFSFLLSISIASAQWPPHTADRSGIRLEISSANRFILLINGLPYSMQGKLFELEAIPAGRHLIEIGYFSSPGWNRKLVTVFHQYVDFYSGQRLIGRVHHNGHLLIGGYEPIYPAATQCPPIHLPPHGSTCLPLPPASGGNGPSCPFPRPPFPCQLPVLPQQGWGYVRPLSNQELAALIQVIRQRPFDSDRLVIARQALENAVLSASQVRQILELFSFESTRLEFARLAYDHCPDKHLYYLIYDAFDFSGSIHSLEQFIAGR